MDDEHRSLRPLLASVGGEASVRVVLESEGLGHVGECAVDDRGRAWAAARATVDALSNLTPETVEFVLDWCQETEPGADLPPVVTALVTVRVVGVAMRYAGAATVKGDPASAGAKAALSAMNRRLEVAG